MRTSNRENWASPPKVALRSISAGDSLPDTPSSVNAVLDTPNSVDTVCLTQDNPAVPRFLDSDDESEEEPEIPSTQSSSSQTHLAERDAALVSENERVALVSVEDVKRQMRQEKEEIIATEKTLQKAEDTDVIMPTKSSLARDHLAVTSAALVAESERVPLVSMEDEKLQMKQEKEDIIATEKTLRKAEDTDVILPTKSSLARDHLAAAGAALVVESERNAITVEDVQLRMGTNFALADDIEEESEGETKSGPKGGAFKDDDTIDSKSVDPTMQPGAFRVAGIDEESPDAVLPSTTEEPDQQVPYYDEEAAEMTGLVAAKPVDYQREREQAEALRQAQREIDDAQEQLEKMVVGEVKLVEPENSKRKYLLLLGVLVLIAILIILLVVLLGNDSEDGPAPKPKPLEAIASTEELQIAIRDYLQDDSRESEVAQRYGWPIGAWNVSQVNDFSRLFEDQSDFNEELNGWDTSRATNMSRMFRGALSFNQPLDHLDVSLVTDFSGMFQRAESFNQDLNNWNTSSAMDMQFAFSGAASFQKDLDRWGM